MTRKTGTDKMADEKRLDQVEADVNELRTAMTNLAITVNKGFSDINIRMDDSNKGSNEMHTKIDARIEDGNKELMKEIGSLYGKMNTHALEDAKHRNVSWPLVVSVIAVIFVALSFFYTTINDRFDRTIRYEKELRQSENQNILLQSELNFTKQLLRDPLN